VVSKFLSYFPKTSVNYKVSRCGSTASVHSDERVAMLREFLKRKKDMSPVKLQHRGTFLEWNYKAELYAFAKRIGEDFADNTLQQALTQRSYVIAQKKTQNELGIDDPKGYLEDNQYLSEKGRDLSRDFVARYLRTAIPSLPEEGIQLLRNHLLSEDNLANIVSNIGAEELILCTDFPTEKQTRVSTFYALVGAIEESNGRERGALFVRDFIIASLSGQDIHAIYIPENKLELLTEIFVREGKEVPEPRLINQTGVNTIIPSFRVGLYCAKKYIGSGDGESVQVAVENAALNVLWKLWGMADGKLEFPYLLDISSVLSNNQTNVPEQEWTPEKTKQSSSFSR